MSFIFSAIENILFFVIGIQAWYLFVFAVAGLFPRKLKMNKEAAYVDFTVLIPTYKEDKVILDTAKAALQVNYPK